MDETIARLLAPACERTVLRRSEAVGQRIARLLPTAMGLVLAASLLPFGDVPADRAAARGEEAGAARSRTTALGGFGQHARGSAAKVWRLPAPPQSMPRPAAYEDVFPTLPGADSRSATADAAARGRQRTQPPVAPRVAGPLEPALPPPVPRPGQPREPSQPPGGPQLTEAVRRAALGHTSRGFELAARAALYSARTEFLRALEVIALGWDEATGTAEHRKALLAGLRALDEAADFVPRSGPVEDDDARLIAAAHRTAIVKDEPAAVTREEAARRYYNLGQQQIALSQRGAKESADALHALGKLHEELTRQPAPRIGDAQAKAMVYYQAALVVDPNHARAANDLAVQLARGGSLESARAWLEHSVGLAPQAEVWHNLAVVQRQLGEEASARAAEQQARQAARSRGRSAAIQWPDVKWLAPRDFASLPPDPLQETRAGRPAVPSAPAQEPQAESSGRWDWLPWK